MGSDLATMVIWCCLGWFRFDCVQLAVRQYIRFYIVKIALIGRIFHNHMIYEQKVYIVWMA